MIQVKRELRGRRRDVSRREGTALTYLLRPRVSLTNTDNSSVGSVGSVSDQVIGECVNGVHCDPRQLVSRSMPEMHANQ